MNLFLMGYRGTGKTTVARLLADRLQWRWCDADVEIERRAATTISQIFADSGEAGFRDIESEVVRDLAGRSETIVALGGGAVLRPENRQTITAAGPVVWLTAPAEVLFRRINEDLTTEQRRPKLTSHGGIAEIQQLLRQREPIYRETASHVVSTEQRTPGQVADEIADWFRTIQRSLANGSS